jgi:predicted amidohydrolase YtcJ
MMRVPFFAFALAGVTAIAALQARQSTPAPADLVVVNGRVYTVDPQRAEAQAVAIRGDRIVAVGSTAEVAALRGPRTQVIDAGGRAIIPGLHDAHGHVLGLGESLQQIDLRGTPSAQTVLDKVRTRAAQLPKGRWILGRGWDQNDWPEAAWPTAAQLDTAAPDHPVYLSRVDGHAAWVNTTALRAATVTAATGDGPRVAAHPTT